MTTKSSKLCTFTTDQNMTISRCVELSVQTYFDHLDGTPVQHLYEFVINEVEQPLLKTVLQHTGGNQSKAAEILGLNRGTLRKKLKEHNLL